MAEKPSISFREMLRNEPPRWALLADDLTGACDAGVPFALAGFRVVHPLGHSSPIPLEAELLALSTESREMPPATAHEVVVNACRRLTSEGYRLIFKKIDSTLRGNVEAEILAALEGSGLGSAVVCPAFPSQGRLVIGGRLKVRSEWSSACLPRNPLLPVADAVTDDDLRQLALDLLERNPPALPVGSAGLAAAWAGVLAELLGNRGAAAELPRTDRPVLFLVGSEQATTAAQVELLLKQFPAEEISLQGLEPDPARGTADALVTRIENLEAVPAQIAPLKSRLEAAQAGALVLCGGATARAVLNALQAHAITLGGEVLPGIPWGHIVGGAADGLPVVTKAGGFGAPDAFQIVASKLLVASKLS